jgi:glycosyltransferase involved in cell wall biosynthesis
MDGLVSRPARVVFVNRFFFPDEAATSQLLSDLAFATARSGRQVTVVTSSQRYRGGVGLARAETIQGVAVRRLWTPERGRASLAKRAIQYLAFYLGAAWHLLRMLRRGDILVVLTDPPALSVPAAVAAWLRDARLVNWLQDVFPEVGTQLGVRVPGHRLIARARNWSLRRARANVVLSHGMGGRLAVSGADPGRIRIIENWTDDEAIRPLEPCASPYRREWALEDRFVVAYSGNLGRAHEFGTMLDAAELLEADPGIAFLLIGDGYALAAICTRIAERGLTNIVIQPPQPRERLSDVLGVADVHLVSLRPSMEGLVVPSKYYGVLAAGRAVIYVGDADGDLAREIVRCDCGRVVAPGDAIELARQIRSLRDDSGECRALGERARRLSQARHTRRAALQRWQQLFSALES